MYEQKLYKIGLQVKKARQDTKLTCEALAQVCDISPTYLRGIEAGSKMPSHGLLIKICKATGKDMNFFYAPYVVLPKEAYKADKLDCIIAQLGMAERELAANVLYAIYPDKKNDFE